MRDLEATMRMYVEGYGIGLLGPGGIRNHDIPLTPSFRTCTIVFMSGANQVTALKLLRSAHVDFEAASIRRHEAIVTASQAGNSLREISAAMDGRVSYEVIRGIVGPRAGVAFEWAGETFPVSEPQTRALIYKADGYGRRAFPVDVDTLGAGDSWLPAAADLAGWMRRVHVGLDPDPIVLDEDHAFALFQILRLTYMDGLSRLAELRSSFFNDFGRPAATGRKRG